MMAGRKAERQTESRKPAGEARTESRFTDKGRPWLLAGLVALLVVRPLYASESAALRGDGLPVVMLWIALAVCWLLAAVGQPKFRIRFGWIDWGVLLLLGWHSVSAVAVAGHGNLRLALNMLWEWVGLGLAFFLARQLIRGPRETRAVLAVMISLAVVLSAYGFYQCLYEMPAARALYYADPDRALREAGLWFPPGSHERDSFESRLANTEPIATFALTNSLAGFLAPWLIVALGITLGGPLLRREKGNGPDRPRGLAPFSFDENGTVPLRRSWTSTIGRQSLLFLVGMGLCLILMAGCLVMTKSRSGYLAVLLGGALTILWCRPWKSSRLRRWLAAAGAVGVVLAAITAVAVARDSTVLARAVTSLSYRLEYWQASLAMVADYPLLGCGPGNFQGEYTRYKLPAASEEVSDPHNFLFEIWTTAGTPALLALLGILTTFFVVQYRNCRRQPSQPDSKHSSVEPPTATEDRPKSVIWGALAGAILALLVGMICAAPPGLAVWLIGLPLASGVLVVLWPWIERGQVPPALPTIGVLALLVDLSAAGGLGFPGVAVTLWLLLALGLNQTDREAEQTIPRWKALTLLAVVLVALATCYDTAYRPVTESQTRIRQALQVLTTPEQAEFFLSEATSADALAAEPWNLLASHVFQRWQHEHTAGLLERFQLATNQGLERAPNMCTAWLVAGDRYFMLFKSTRFDDYLGQALSHYRRAVELYPNSGTYRAKFALALQAAGQEAESRQQAAKALELDDLTPHRDKHLDPSMRKELSELLAKPSDRVN